ncbi:hypothetical protein J4O76_20095 [Sphingomonas sp. NFX23]
MLAMMMLQATVTPADQGPPIDFDLRSSADLRSSSCRSPATDDGEILVCGRRDADSRYRLKPLDTSRYEPNRRAETTLVGDLKGAAEVEQKELAPGMTSNRIMFRLKLPF